MRKLLWWQWLVIGLLILLNLLVIAIGALILLGKMPV
jgi:hypothetical protein